MKTLILAISCVAIIASSCDSNKDGFKSSKNAQRATISAKPRMEGSVSRLNSEELVSPSTTVDPAINAKNSARTVDYSKPGVVYPGTSGAGSGSSYASVSYAAKKKKSKPAPATVNEIAQNNISDAEIILNADSATGTIKTNSTLDW